MFFGLGFKILGLGFRVVGSGIVYSCGFRGHVLTVRGAQMWVCSSGFLLRTLSYHKNKDTV